MVGGLRPAVEKAYCAFHNFSRGHFIKRGALWLTFCEPHCFEQWAAFRPPPPPHPYFKFIFCLMGSSAVPWFCVLALICSMRRRGQRRRKRRIKKLVNTAIIHGWLWKRSKSRVGTEMVRLDRFLLVSIRSSWADWGHRSRNCWLTFRSKLSASRRRYFKSAWCEEWDSWWEENLSRRKEHPAAVRWKLTKMQERLYWCYIFLLVKSFTLCL